MGRTRRRHEFLAFCLRCDLGACGAAGRGLSATIVLLSAALWRWGSGRARPPRRRGCRLLLRRGPLAFYW